MHMKKLYLILCVGILLLLAGCTNTTIDTAAMEETLVDQLTYSDQLYKVSDEFVENYIDLEPEVTAVMYMGSGITADQLAIFTCPDPATAQLQEEHVRFFVEEQRASFANYIPVEAKRLEDGLVIRKGRYVFLSVSETPDVAKSIINEAF